MIDKLPALHFYVQDYLADTRSLSNETKGFYVDLLCYMHKSSRRGFLQQPNGNPYSPVQLGTMTGCSADEASRLLRDLLSSEVISATPKGIPYSRRMVRDEKKRVLCKRAGLKGGNPTLKGQLKGGGYPSPEDEDKDLNSSDLGGDARGGIPPHVRSTLSGVDPGHLMPAPPDPPNLAATRAAIDPNKPLTAKEEFWGALCRIFGLEPKTQADELRLYQQCTDFRLKGATVAEIERRAGIYRASMPNVAFTPKAVLSNWDNLKEPPAPKVSQFAPAHIKKTRALT